ncbi:ABC transporter permease [Amycolatopsis alkalitolerans]|uniref:ABC transporter permease n=1 Tax=Amycolatopsis alkalitolerans TaxID=2547244 RepID=A0A5C4M939_9PSEU|nr:ABC transporter permease [Amycolatopsis alkalitolerans]TNC29088.1 ABC transporter permease [Amycolatopsis alkalitolerans]
MTAIALAWMRRLARDRISLFFMVLLPVVVILIIGAAVRGQPDFRVGVVTGAGPAAEQLSTDLGSASTLDTRSYPDEDSARAALRRAEIDAAVLIPSDMDSAHVEIPLLTTGSTSAAQGVWSAVSAVVAQHAATVQAARFAAAEAGGTTDTRLPLARSLAAEMPRVSVRTEAVGTADTTLPPGFSYSAPTMLVLFVFINAVAGGAALAQTRKLGIYTRALASPVRARDIVLGETACYFGLALAQSLFIVGIGAGFFGVRWGDPLAAAVLIAVWALVGAGAGMLSGSLFRTPEQASAIGPAIGIGLGMLGGCMWPLEIVPPVVREIGHIAPHAWAVDAWTRLLARGEGIAGIGMQLAVLAGFAVVLLVSATFMLNRALRT